MQQLLLLEVLLLGDPALPEEPAEKRAKGAPAGDGDGRHARVEDGDEADDEDDDGADVLQDDGRIGDERPKVVRLEARVALQVFEKRGLVGVVIGVYAITLELPFVQERAGSCT